jgi:hypothetical protein
MNEPGDKSKVQGEGNYEAARRYDKAQRDFVQSGKVEEGARKAHPDSAAQEADMEKAEDIGKSHSKGELPADEKSTGKGSAAP